MGGDREVGGAVEPCPLKRVINARWRSNPVKCGSDVGMVADTVNIPAGTSASFAVKRVTDNSLLSTENNNTGASSVQVDWTSKKPSADWDAPEVKFKVSAAGVDANSQEAHLSFYSYPDIAQTNISGRMQSPPAPATARFGWDKKVFIRFSDKKLVLTVKIRLRNKTQARPEREKKESYADWKRRCREIPVGAPVPGAAKQTMKEGIESVYRDEQYLHREACQRNDSCDCDLANRCCKFPVEVIVEFVETSGAMIHEVNLWPGTGRASSNDWYRIESRPGKTWPHEVGHLMGFYDEYSSGAIGNPPWQTSSSTSIMGSGNEVFDYHLEEFRAWFNDRAGEPFKLIEI